MGAVASRRRDLKLDRLARQPLLDSCSFAELRFVSTICDEVEVPAGQVVVRQGFRGHWFFLIEEGTADVLDGNRRVSTLVRGEWFGNAGPGAGSEPYTVVARTPIRVFVVHQRHVPALAEALPAVGAVIPGGRAPALRPVREELAPVIVLRRRPDRRRLRLKQAAVAFVVALAAFGASALYHPPAALLEPGPVVDVVGDITITGTPTHAPSGRYLMTSVRISRPSLLQASFAWFLPDRELVSLDRVVPPGADPAALRREQLKLFRESRMIAAAAAARAVGLSVHIGGTGARVTHVAPSARDRLREGDVVVAIDGRPIRLAPDVEPALGTKPIGSAFRFTVERDGRRFETQMRSVQWIESARTVASVGALWDTRDLDVRLPFELRFRERDIGGRSAGLAFALAIADLLDSEDDAHGRAIAATGTIELDGTVGSVAGLSQKLRAVRRAGAEVLVVPVGQSTGPWPESLRLVGTQSLQATLRALRAAS